MKKIYYYIYILLLLSFSLQGQPTNDNCANASLISLPLGGYGTGTVFSDTITIDNATLQFGEFIPAGLPNGKSIWFKFSLPTTRKMRIILRQNGTSMNANDAGWTLYRTNSCLPGASEVVDPPIFNIEGYTHQCLRAGDYLLQVSIDLLATGQLFLEIQVDPSDAAENDYDFAGQPQVMGIISGGAWNPLAKVVNWEAGCQSIFSGEENCSAQFTKSSWHIFTTDSYVDWVRIALRENPWNSSNNTPRDWRIFIYEGDARTDSINLPKIDSCVAMTQTGNYNYSYLDKICELKPNTTYSVKVLYPTDYYGNMEMRIWERGANATISPNPTTIPSSHQLGVLTNGPTYTINDYFACNSLIKYNKCGSVVPTDTINSGGGNYDLSFWFTFELSTATDVNFNTYYYSSQPGVRYRIFAGDVTTDCNIPLVDEFTGNKLVHCMQAGVYSVQVMGRINLGSIADAWGSNLGEQVQVRITLDSPVISKFGLHSPTEADSINNGNPLQPGVTYNAIRDSIDCRTTYLPAGDVCGSTNDRALYRVFKINQNGYITIGGGNWWRFRYRLYRGDARTAPVVGNELQGLIDQAGCQSTYYPFKVCVTPGTYTLVTFGDISDVGESDRPWFKFDTLPTPQFISRSTAENLDTLSLSNPTLSATPQTFTCLNNPDTILGYAPCSGSMKLFYWEFYVKDPSLVYFDFWHNRVANAGSVSWRVFQGRISTGNVNSLFRDCTGDFNSCLSPGWYTVVAYGYPGGTWSSPAYTSGRGGVIGNTVGFSVNMDTRVQRFETFAKADSVNGLSPVDWYNTGTAQVPQNHKTYNFGEEFWACYDNLPFPPGIDALKCDPSYNRVSYHVFRITKPSYVHIYNLNPYPYGYNSILLQGDITDGSTAPPYTVVHPCTTNPMDICWLAPGDYTLVVFAKDNHIGRTHRPTIYIDSVGTSLHDHANFAYDFDNIPNDNTFHFGNLSSPLDAMGRPASNDFIFCTTGSQTSDPDNICPNGVNGGTDYTGRKNLWYTFTVTGPGRVYVRVNALTNGASQPGFTVYKSDDVNFPTVVDSTFADGLERVVSSQGWWCCTQYNTISFYRDPCSTPATQTDRYYVLVDRNTCGKLPNIQIQTGIRFEPAPPTYVLYDHYSDANVITGTPTTQCLAPYTPVALDSGYYIGCEGNLTCATKDPTDQNSCGTHTIWYKFESNIGGLIRINYDRTDVGSYNLFNGNDIKLYRSVVPGDSTSSGLVEVPLSSVWRTHPDSGNVRWGEGCVQPGTYYIMLTGCNHLGFVVPKIWLLKERGDYCSSPIVLNASLNGADSVVVADSAIINCFTIGDAPGETDTLMGCLGSPIGKKSMWIYVENNDTFKMDYDITIYENTTAFGGDVDYQIGNGDCSAMTFDNCVDEGVYITLNLRCRAPSTGFWVQVVMPDWATGDIKVEVKAKPAVDSLCVPLDPTKPKANFDYTASCVTSAVQFINNSTTGAGVTYLWDFGDGFTSTQFQPTHNYAVADTYLVTLIVDNGTYKDTTQKYVIVYPKANVSFTYTPASPVFAGTPITFTPIVSDTVPTVTYYWNFCAGPPPCSANMIDFIGKYPPPVYYNYPGTKVVCLTVTNGNCSTTYCDTIVIKLEDIYPGGPYDGFAEANIINNCIPPIFAGGPYDGTDTTTYESNCNVNIFAGGPYDGTDTTTYESNCNINIFAGGPYDGTDTTTYESNCNVNIFAGGPYDGTDTTTYESNCNADIFTGGPYDGFALDYIQASCYTVTPYTGGPYDGFAEASIVNCPPPVSVYEGGPYDGFAEANIINNCSVNIFAGGPYDGTDTTTYQSNCNVNIFAGGPYDGTDTTIYQSNCNVNIFAGGPYDGTDTTTYKSNCNVNIFAGGPYDGFDIDTSICPKPPIYTGGPYDGFAEAYLTGFHLISSGNDTICAGETGMLVSNEPTNWYNSPIGGTLVVSNEDTLIITNATNSQVYYIENTCSGERIPAVLTVYPYLNGNFVYSPAAGCKGQSVYFSNQTLVSGPSQPSIGTYIMGFGTHGTPPGPGQLTFSSVYTANFNYLYDGIHQQNQAWTANNSGATTVWAQWNFLSPRSVNRIVFWNRNNCCGANAPKYGRLYYDDGTGWKLAKFFTFPYPSNANYDSGIFSETQLIFANRWKLELDVLVAQAPMWGEFQVYSSSPVVGGNVQWNFGDGSPYVSGNTTAHTYADTGTYNVSMIVNMPGTCPDTITKQLQVIDCNPLPVIASLLNGIPNNGDILLNWKTDTKAQYVRLEKLQNNLWTKIYESYSAGETTFTYLDTLPYYGVPNVYRVYSEHSGQAVYSNLVSITLTKPQQEFVKIYPNPVVENYLNLAFGLIRDKNVSYEIYDVAGKLIYKHKFRKLPAGIYSIIVPVNNITSGVYVIKIKLGSTEYNKKFIRIRP